MGISRNEALDCFRSNDLIGIGMEADAVRRRLHPDGVVSYILDSLVDYGQPSAAHDFKRITRSIADTVEMGGTSVTLQGNCTLEPSVEWFEELLRNIKNRFPDVWLHGLSAGEILAIAAHAGATLADTIARLRDAGLDSISGDDAGILDDAVQLQGRNIKAADWLVVHRMAHRLGIQTTSTMTFGAGETFEHRVHHLEALRQLQQETGGFASFTPVSFAPLSATVRGFEEPTAVEYLKTLAISRMVLDDIDNVQSNLETQGLKVLQVGLRFGANDAGSVLLAKGAQAATEEQVRQVIRDAGFKPAQRDTLYRTMFVC